MIRRGLAFAILALLVITSGARADDGRALASALKGLPADYTAASVRHDTRLALRLRTEGDIVAARLKSAPLNAEGRRALARLQRALGVTRDELQPWPLPTDVNAQAAEVARAARAAVPPQAAVPPKPYDAIRDALEESSTRAATGDATGAQVSALDAWGLYEQGFGARLAGSTSPLETALWEGSGAKPGVLLALTRGLPAGGATKSARNTIEPLRQSLGDATVSRGSVITDAAVLVFREGLEAVLILAAITASFTGARRHLRKPVLWGGLVGLGATAITWVIAEVIIDQLGNGGLELEAITGLLAIGVLLLITNWFFHKVYWSQWISRFNKQRKRLEKLDRVGMGFVSGQVLGLILLGATSVYREGFETVLFLQNLNVSAGSSATLLGAGIGLAATLGVGGITFGLQRKLPYKKMLIATGVMIAIVLAVMVGSTVHVMQGLGWLPSHATPFTPALWMNRWIGLWPTWEGVAIQVFAFVFVVGSYVVAREVQVKRPARKRAASARTRSPQAVA